MAALRKSTLFVEVQNLTEAQAQYPDCQRPGTRAHDFVIFFLKDEKAILFRGTVYQSEIEEMTRRELEKLKQDVQNTARMFQAIEGIPSGRNPLFIAGRNLLHPALVEEGIIFNDNLQKEAYNSASSIKLSVSAGDRFFLTAFKPDNLSADITEANFNTRLREGRFSALFVKNGIKFQDLHVDSNEHYGEKFKSYAKEFSVPQGADTLILNFNSRRELKRMLQWVPAGGTPVMSYSEPY